MSSSAPREPGRGGSGGREATGPAPSPAEVSSRINRILEIVKGPTAKGPAGDESAKNSTARSKGTARRGARNTGAGGGGYSGSAEGGGGGGSGGGSGGGGGGGGGAPAPAPAGPSEGAPQPRRRRGGAAKGRGGGGPDAESDEDVRNAAVEPFMVEPLVDPESDGSGTPAGRSAGRPSESLALQATALNPAAPIFVPSASEAFMAYTEADWSYTGQGDWAGTPAGTSQEGDEFPQVVLGRSEHDFIGLQCIAEMGDWVALREPKAGCRPFFWNRLTGAKTSETPQIIKETGVADLLAKWSAELPSHGIEPGPEVWPEPLRPRASRAGGGGTRRGGAKSGPLPPSPAPAPQREGRAAPPGFERWSADAEEPEESRRTQGRGGGRNSRRPKEAAPSETDAAKTPGFTGGDHEFPPLHEGVRGPGRPEGGGRRAAAGAAAGAAADARLKAPEGEPRRGKLWQPKASGEALHVAKGDECNHGSAQSANGQEGEPGKTWQPKASCAKSGDGDGGGSQA